jgi:hypothetical protein
LREEVFELALFVTSKARCATNKKYLTVSDKLFFLMTFLGLLPMFLRHEPDLAVPFPLGDHADNNRGRVV